MKTLSWGKCWIYVRKLVSGTASDKWIKFPIPVEDSTNLTPTKGDKQEATVEGGEAEAVKYKKNKYALTTQIRIAPEQPKPLSDDDGVIDGSYEVIVRPELEGAIALKIDNATLSASPEFNTANGIVVEYTADAVKPSKGNTVKFGTVTVTGEDTDSETPTFKEIGEE